MRTCYDADDLVMQVNIAIYNEDQHLASVAKMKNFGKY